MGIVKWKRFKRRKNLIGGSRKSQSGFDWLLGHQVSIKGPWKKLNPNYKSVRLIKLIINPLWCHSRLKFRVPLCLYIPLGTFLNVLNQSAIGCSRISLSYTQILMKVFGAQERLEVIHNQLKMINLKTVDRVLSWTQTWILITTLATLENFRNHRTDVHVLTELLCLEGGVHLSHIPPASC